MEPYCWDTLIAEIEKQFIEEEHRLKKNFFCLDGLDENWDTSDPSLYFLAQLVRVAQTLSYKLKNSVKFIICLRDNIFRTLVDTKFIEYDKLESYINYLQWDGHSLFKMISCRSFPKLNTFESVNQLKKILPNSIDEKNIEDYLSTHILNRPRDYINFFNTLKSKTVKVDFPSEIHIKDAIATYNSNRLSDLENEFGLTYPNF